MKTISNIITLVFVSLWITSCTTSTKLDTTQFVDSKKNEQDELVLDHKYFVIVYDKSHNIAKWVRYTLIKSDLNGPGIRPSRFKADPLLQKLNIKTIKHEDYTNSGYARGHLAPAEDFSRSQDAIESTFIMSNVIPQKGSVNSGAWAQLEKKVRSWACGEGSITVYTGPVIERDLSSLPTGVLIPNKFFKVVIDNTPPEKSIAFIYNQNESGQRLEQKVTSLEQITSVSELSLFRKYPETSANHLEDWKECKK